MARKHQLPADPCLKRIKEHVPKSVDSFCCLDKRDDLPAKVLNEFKRSSISRHLLNNPTCAKNYNINRFKITKTCNMSSIWLN